MKQRITHLFMLAVLLSISKTFGQTTFDWESGVSISNANGVTQTVNGVTVTLTSPNGLVKGYTYDETNANPSGSKTAGNTGNYEPYITLSFSQPINITSLYVYHGIGFPQTFTATVITGDPGTASLYSLDGANIITNFTNVTELRLTASDPAGTWLMTDNIVSDFEVDTDGDGDPDVTDPDDDNDGQTDVDEMACGSDSLDAGSTSPDNDGDNIPDCVDTDDDNDGDSDTDETACGSDPFNALETCSTLGVDKISLDDAIQLYPNPARTEVKIKTGNNIMLEGITIYSYLGKKVLTTSSSTIDVSNFSSGLYIIKIKSDRGSVTKKFIVE